MVQDKPFTLAVNLGRRGFLKATGAFATVALAFQAAPAARAAQVRSLVPVAVSLDRVTRTTVGLRPYRPSGFVLRAEGHDDKTIVHVASRRIQELIFLGGDQVFNLI